MAVVLTGTGGLMTRIGKDGKGIDSVNGFRGNGDISAGGILSVGVFFDNIEAQYQSSRRDLSDGIYALRDAYRSVHSSVLAGLQSHALNVLIQMFVDDASIRSADKTSALKQLIAQMIGNSDSVKGNTVSVSTAIGTNNGTAAIAASIKGPDGKNLQYPFAETINFSASSDFQSGGTRYGDTWNVTGAVAVTDTQNFTWPAGSGLASAITTANPSSSSTSPSFTQNLLVNGDMELFTTNVPNKWTVDVGTAGTTIFQGSSTFRGGASALKITGNGSELTSLLQKFNDSTLGTGYQLLPNTVYAFSCWAKVSTVVAEAGVLAFSLVDNSGTVINDAASTANTISTTLLGTIGTSYTNIHGFFRTPAVLAATSYSLRIKLTTALTSGTDLYIDDVCLVNPFQLYTGGPFVSIFPGNSDVVKLDSFTVTVSNNWGGNFQKLFERWFGMRSLGLTLPFVTDGSQTITDTF